jgi:hypothetical protein
MTTDVAYTLALFGGIVVCATLSGFFAGRRSGRAEGRREEFRRCQADLERERGRLKLVQGGRG